LEKEVVVERRGLHPSVWISALPTITWEKREKKRGERKRKKKREGVRIPREDREASCKHGTENQSPESFHVVLANAIRVPCGARGVGGGIL